MVTPSVLRLTCDPATRFQLASEQSSWPTDELSTVSAPSGNIPSRKRLRDWLATTPRVRHPFTHLAQGPRAVPGSTAAALAEAHARVEQGCEGSPRGDVSLPGRGERRTGMDHRLRATRTDSLPRPVVRLLVGDPAGEADVRGLRMGHEVSLEVVPKASHRVHVRKGRRLAARGLRRPNWPTTALSHTRPHRTADGPGLARVSESTTTSPVTNSSPRTEAKGIVQDGRSVLPWFLSGADRALTERRMP